MLALSPPSSPIGASEVLPSNKPNTALQLLELISELLRVPQCPQGLRPLQWFQSFVSLPARLSVAFVAPVNLNISEYESIDTWIDYFGPLEHGSPALSDLFKPSLHLKDITKSSESSREGQKLKRLKFYTTTSCLFKSSLFVK